MIPVIQASAGADVGVVGRAEVDVRAFGEETAGEAAAGVGVPA